MIAVKLCDECGRLLMPLLAAAPARNEKALLNQVIRVLEQCPDDGCRLQIAPIVRDEFTRVAVERRWHAVIQPRGPVQLKQRSPWRAGARRV